MKLRSARLTILLSYDDLSRLKKEAEKIGLTSSAFLRSLLLRTIGSKQS